MTYCAWHENSPFDNAELIINPGRISSAMMMGSVTCSIVAPKYLYIYIFPERLFCQLFLKLQIHSDKIKISQNTKNRKFNDKFKEQKERKKLRRIRNKLKAEMTADTKASIQQRRTRDRFVESLKEKKINRIRNEIQQETRNVYKENTSLAKTRRIKKKGDRKAGNKF